MCFTVNFAKTAIALCLKDLIFTGKLEMLVASFLAANNAGQGTTKKFRLL